jgi:hypothetical protein
MRWAPINHIDTEINRFDQQKMQNPEISGIEYQQGTLQGYDIREYLLQKYDWTCVYCQAGKPNKKGIRKSVILQIEHIIPKSRGGSDRLSNLTIACEACNHKKDNKTAEEFGYPDIQSQVNKPLHEAAYMNAVRYKLRKEIEKLSVSSAFWTGSQTKINRVKQGYPKDHWIDAACVGDSGSDVRINNSDVYQIKCIGHGSRQMVLMNKLGYPRNYPKVTAKKRRRDYFGYKSGDYVKAIVTKGKRQGVYKGIVICRERGQFSINGAIDGIDKKYFQLLQKRNGYSFTLISNINGSSFGGYR